MNKNNNRNLTIDVLKGIAVLAVLLGHAIQRGMVFHYESNFMFKIIYSFHMPLFMILSGYSLNQFTKNYNFNFLKKRFLKLLIPTIVWSYLIYFFRNFDFVGIKEFILFPNSILEYTKILILHPDMVIWFLYIVFLCTMCFFFQKKIIKSQYQKFELFFTIIITILIYLLPNKNFGILKLQIYFPLFSIGYYISKYPFVLKYSTYLIIPSLLLYCVLFPRFNVVIDNKIIYYLIAISAIIVLYNIVHFLNLKILSNILSFFGKKSLEIYLCQCLCLNIGLGTGYLRIFSIFITATMLSVFLTFITKKSTILKFLLYGEKTNKNDVFMHGKESQ